jgi:hypothetical protein
MDLRSYYKKVREAEAGLDSDHIVVVSIATAEGGKAGVRTEAPRHIAARLVADGTARVATEGEAREFREANQAALLRHEQDEAARRLQVMVIPSHDLRKPKERS